MNNIIKFTSGLLLTSSLLFAEDSRGRDDCKGPVLCPIAPMEQRMDCCNRFHVDIGLLYEQPVFSFMMPGAEGHYELPPIDPNALDPSNETADWLFQCFDYSLGLTASLGYFMDHDSWYLGANFDWLSSSLYKRYNLNDESDNVDLQNIPEFYGTEDYNDNYYGIHELQDEFFRSLNYSAKFNFYSFNVLLSRGSYHSPTYSLEPYAAINAIWFDNYQKTNYFNEENTGYSEIHKKNWGAGPMFGVDGEYYFSCAFSLFMDSSISLLYGESSSFVDTDYILYDNDAHTELDEHYFTTENRKTYCQYFVPVRSILGVQFSKFCFEDSHYLAIKLGFDVRMVLSYPEIDRGFAMSGLYTNLIWNF